MGTALIAVEKCVERTITIVIPPIRICNIRIFCCQSCLSFEVVWVKDVGVGEALLIMMHAPDIEEENAAFG